MPDPRLSGPGAGPAAGPVIRRAKFFRFFSILFFPVRAGPVGSYGRKNLFSKKKNHHFFILISPKPLPKPSDGPKKHPQTLKKK